MRISIKADDSQKGGTRFYKIMKDELVKYAWETNENVWTRFLLENHFKDSILDDVMFTGSKIVDGSLYYCVTDLLPISIGDDYIEPEDALNVYTPKQLSDYVSESAPDSVLDKIDPDDFSFKGIDLEDAAITLLDDGETLYRLFHDADSLSLVSE